MNNNPYSSSKILYHLEELNGIKKGIQIVPKQIHLVASDYCNQDCSWCSYRQSNYTSNELFKVVNENGVVNNNPKRQIEFNKLTEIVDDCVDLKINSIQATGGGEFLAHKNHKEFFEYAIFKNIELALVTNGSILKEGMSDLICKFKWIRFSIDAGNEKTYSETRKVPENIFFKVKENIKEIVKRKKELNSDVTIGIGFVVNKYNWKEIYGAVRQAKELGVDNIRISALFQNDHFSYFNDFYEKSKLLIADSICDFQSNNFNIYDRFGSRVEDLKQESPDYEICYYAQFVTYIGADLNVYMCCTTAYSTYGKIGSIKNQRFKDFWLSQEKQDFFNKFNPKKCNLCMFNDRNKIIKSILTKPMHENYV